MLRRGPKTTCSTMHRPDPNSHPAIPVHMSRTNSNKHWLGREVTRGDVVRYSRMLPTQSEVSSLLPVRRPVRAPEARGAGRPFP